MIADRHEESTSAAINFQQKIVIKFTRQNEPLFYPRWSVKGGHKIVQFLGRSLKSSIGGTVASCRKRGPAARLVEFRLVGQRMSGHVAVRLGRTVAGQSRVVGMMAQIAEQLRMAGDVALRRRIDADLSDVVREVRMLWHVADQRRMVRHGADGQRERTALAHQPRVLWMVGDVADDGTRWRRQFRMSGHVADGLGRNVAFRHVTRIVGMMGDVA